MNNIDDITLLIDTGASITTLSTETFNSLKTQYQATLVGTRLFQTANGTTKGTVYTFDTLALGSYQMNNVQIAILNFDMKGNIGGLLGMNVLRRYRFQIDQENNVLLLEKK